MKQELNHPKGLADFMTKYAEEVIEPAAIRTDFENDLKDELEKNHSEAASICLKPTFIDALWDNVVLFASMPISESAPNLAESLQPEAKKSGRKILRAAQKIRDMIDKDKEHLELLDIEEYAGSLDYLIEDLGAALKEVPIAKPDENRKVNAKNWKTEFAVDLLVRRFDKSRYRDLISTTEDGVFVKTAEIVLKKANELAKENGGESFVNTSPRTIKEIMRKMRKAGQLPSK